MQVASILSHEAVFPDLQARDKKHALKTVATLASELWGLSEKTVLQALIQREEQGSTGMGHGVCIPHARLPDIEKTYALFARLEEPLPFDAMDGKPVLFLFMLLSPANDNTQHVKALACISRQLRNRSLCEQLREARDGQAIYALLVAPAADNGA